MKGTNIFLKLVIKIAVDLFIDCKRYLFHCCRCCVLGAGEQFALTCLKKLHTPIATHKVKRKACNLCREESAQHRTLKVMSCIE